MASSVVDGSRIPIDSCSFNETPPDPSTHISGGGSRLVGRLQTMSARAIPRTGSFLWILGLLALGCASSEQRSSTEAGIRGSDTADQRGNIQVELPGSGGPTVFDSSLSVTVSLSGSGLEAAFTTPDGRAQHDSISPGLIATPPARPDTDPSTDGCDCVEKRFVVRHVPPGTATLQAAALEDGRIIVTLDASSIRSTSTGWWSSDTLTVRRGQVLRWSIQVPAASLPESLAVVRESPTMP